MIFESRVSGIPCQIQVDYYHNEVPCKRYGDPNDCYEGAPEEFDFTVLDRKGYKAKWLEEKLTRDDIDRILTEFKSN